MEVGERIMDWFQALVAGIIQGVTEFLPISSSGHLVMFHTIFGEGSDANLAFTVFLHLATLLSVVIVFHKDIWTLIHGFFTLIFDIFKGKPDFKSPERRFLLMVIIGTLPAVAVGALLKLLDLDDVLENIFVVAVMLIVTSAFMFMADKLNKEKYSEADAPLKNSLMVGLFQAAAILPGLSRSGTTIFAGLLGGFKKEFAVRYAFILSIPVIVGAGLVEMIDVVKAGSIDISPVSLSIGFISAAICGIIAINLIKLLIKKKAFYIFGIYCLLASTIAFLAGFGVL